jgi:DHA1 family bicyclomycin/chloramphenicol resistance-like MFS transporter
MQTSLDTGRDQPRLGRVGRGEFIALMALTMALTALSINIVLPAFDEMRADFGLAADSTRTAAVITAFFLGMAVAQLPFGVMADRFGRKPTMYAGLAIFVIGAVGSALAPTLESVLTFRFLWGIGAAAPRVVSLGVIRDIFEGDRMARVMSFIAAVFILVPILAPGLGASLLTVVDWRFLFWLCAGLGIAVFLWLLRLPETLAPEHRIPRLQWRPVLRAVRIVVTNRHAVGYTLGLTFVFGAFISYLASSELLWREVYDRGDQFPLIFGGLAAVIGLAMFANGTVVQRVGARRIIHGALFAYVATAGLGLLVALVSGGVPNFWLFLVILGLPLFAHGLLIPNINSVAMAPLGAVAGTASAIIGAFGLLVGSAIGLVIDRMFNGTVIPMIGGFFVGSVLALLVITVSEKGRLFGPT